MMNKMAALITLTVFCVAPTVLHASVPQLNEIRISSQLNDDFNNFFEIAGAPGESLNGLTLIVISAEFEPGSIDFVVDLTGTSIPADGYFLASTDNVFYGAATDLATGIDYFGSPTSFALVSGFTGVQGDDIDSDNDGVPDSALPWSTVVDAVNLTNDDFGAPDLFYVAGPIVGPQGTFTPAHVQRLPNFSGPWGFFADSFIDPSFDTPGAANIPEPTAFSLLAVGSLGLLMRRRRAVA